MTTLLMSLFLSAVGVGSFYFFAFNSGRKKEQDKQLRREYEQLQKDINISKKLNGISFSDKSSFLLSKQSNKNNK